MAGLAFWPRFIGSVREDVTHGPEEIKNTVVSFGCLRPPVALDGRDAPAAGMIGLFATAPGSDAAMGG